MIGTVMKFAAAAALMSAPAAVEAKVQVVSWNAGGKDFPGDYYHFFKSDPVQSADIVFLQESSGSKLHFALKEGWKTEKMKGGLTTAYDPKMFTLIGKDCAELDGDGKARDGTVCTVALKNKYYGIVMASNVHAGHNGKPSKVHYASAETARSQIKDHQKDFVKKHLKGGKAGLIIAGGDHNELGLYLGSTKKSPLMGETAFRGEFGKTHDNGAIDMIFASKTGNSKTLSRFNSDHTAVKATIY